MRLWSLDLREVHVFLAYGPEHVRFIEDIVLPSLEVQSLPVLYHVAVVNYASNQPLFSDHDTAKLVLKDYSSHKQPKRTGFGQNHNLLFNLVSPPSAFVILNPDTALHESCVGELYKVIDQTASTAIVEARQWPFEHPKEYDCNTGDSPWASLFCALIDSEFYRRVGGIDENYFLYTEDVDLSWRMKLSGGRIIYCPSAVANHYTGLITYRDDRFYPEQFFCARNFLYIANKFMGNDGLRAAMYMLHEASFPHGFVENVLSAFADMPAHPDSSELQRMTSQLRRKLNIKLTGFNLFHQVR